MAASNNIIKKKKKSNFLKIYQYSFSKTVLLDLAERR